MINMKEISTIFKKIAFFEANKNIEITLSNIPEKYQYLKDFICVAQIKLKTWEDLRDGVKKFRGNFSTSLGLYIQCLKPINLYNWEDVLTTVGHSKIKDSFLYIAPEWEIYSSEDFLKVLDEMLMFEKIEIPELVLSSKILKEKNDD